MSKKNKLLKVANFVTDKIFSENLSINEYITTDNLLQNKGGKVDVKSLPSKSSNVTRYKKGDVLVSNIRPYLKKIWYASHSGGCSADILVFRTNINTNSKFLFYALFLDDFFIHATKGSKGTKMPRGDKVQIMEYLVSDFTIYNQKKIANVLSVLDDKIELNNRINAELEAMAKTLYDYWFVQFDFPDSNGKPYKSSGGKMVYNETLKREIPEGWGWIILSDCATITRGVTYNKTVAYNKKTTGTVGILRATNIIGNKLNIDNMVYVPNSFVSDHQYLKNGDTLIVMSSGSKEHIGKNGIYHFNDTLGFGAFCSKITIDKNFIYYINIFLQSKWFRMYLTNQCLGTNINNLTNEHIENCIILKPKTNIINKFEEKISVFYRKISINYNQNKKLKTLRDWLLPMLMNGQVKVK